MYGFLALALSATMSGQVDVEGQQQRFDQARRAVSDCSAAFGRMNPLVPQVAYAATGRVLCISGEIDRSLAAAVERELAPEAREVSHVVLHSDSGELGPAIQVAGSLQRLGATAVVGGRCASLCAQVLFVAAPRKIVLKEGWIWFQGGMMGAEEIEGMSIPQGAKESLLRDQQVLQQFYAEHDIDLRLVTQSPPPVRKDARLGMLMIPFWSTDRLAQFGVKDVVQE